MWGEGENLLESRGAMNMIQQQEQLYHNRHLFANDLIMKIKYDSERMSNTIPEDWCSCRYIFSIVFIIQMAANRIFFTYFSRSFNAGDGREWFPLYHTTKVIHEISVPWCGVLRKKERKAVKNHKVDEWSPLSIRGENRINLHFIKTKHFLYLTSSCDVFASEEEEEEAREMLNEKKSWCDFPLIICFDSMQL